MNQRPSYQKPSSNHLQVNVPAGWLTVVGGITRKRRLRLVQICDNTSPNNERYLVSSSKNVVGDVMKELDKNKSDSQAVSFTPSGRDRTLDLKFYHRLRDKNDSENSTGRQLLTGCPGSEFLDIHEGLKSTAAPPYIPDYYTLTVFVGDSEQAKFGDAVATLYFVKKPSEFM